MLWRENLLEICSPMRPPCVDSDIAHPWASWAFFEVSYIAETTRHGLHAGRSTANMISAPRMKMQHDAITLTTLPNEDCFLPSNRSSFYATLTFETIVGNRRCRGLPKLQGPSWLFSQGVWCLQYSALNSDILRLAGDHLVIECVWRLCFYIIYSTYLVRIGLSFCHSLTHSLSPSLSLSLSLSLYLARSRSLPLPPSQRMWKCSGATCRAML